LHNRTSPPKKLFDLPFPLASPKTIRTVSLLLLNLLSFNDEFQTGKKFGFCERIIIVYPLALFGNDQIGCNAKFLLTLQFKNCIHTYHRHYGLHSLHGRYPISIASSRVSKISKQLLQLKSRQSALWKIFLLTSPWYESAATARLTNRRAKTTAGIQIW
jgi:hypothetical protein